MTQNLALDLDPNRVLTSNDTDLKSRSEWTPQSKTQQKLPTLDDGESDLGTSNSWNPGEYVSILPSYNHNCALDLSCEYLQNVTNWQPTFKSQPGIWQDTSYDNISISLADNTYDAHYLLGNYYQKVAATAGANTNANNSQTLDSICPKGWTLPNAERKTNTSIPIATINSFYQLFVAYGYSDQVQGQPLVMIDGLINGANQNLTKSPMYFMRSGSISNLQSINAVGYYWASSIDYNSYITEEYKYTNTTLALTSYHFYPSAIYSDRPGQSIRCLAY